MTKTFIFHFGPRITRIKHEFHELFWILDLLVSSQEGWDLWMPACALHWRASRHDKPSFVISHLSFYFRVLRALRGKKVLHFFKSRFYWDDTPSIMINLELESLKSLKIYYLFCELEEMVLYL